MPRMKLMGFIFVAFGFALYGTCFLWFATRTVRPVNIPILMSIGHIRTPQFRINLNAPFTIDLEVGSNIPYHTEDCLLGTAIILNVDECPDMPSVVRASWVLTSNGKIVAAGSSEEHIGGAATPGFLSRELGAFTGQSGGQYVLDVDVLEDGSALSEANPRLKVEVRPEFYEGESFGSLISLLAAGLLVLVGSILLIVAFIRSRTRDVGNL